MSSQFEITGFQAPTKLRWAERSKNMVTADSGGYDLAPEGRGTRVIVHNVLSGHGFGKLILGPALKAAQKDAEPFAQRIKAAAEAAI